VPEDALHYSVTVTGLADSCHPDSTDGYEEKFDYAVAFDASSATIYVGEDVFAIGSISGCNLSYQTVVIGETTENDGDVRWQLYGEAQMDRGDNACVDGDGDWAGTESFEIVESDSDTLEIGCTYDMTTSGSYVPPG
jgi:hypothetical protein